MIPGILIKKHLALLLSLWTKKLFIFQHGVMNSLIFLLDTQMDSNWKSLF